MTEQPAVSAHAKQDPLVGLRIAIMNLACAPQAQRRYVQLGTLERACDTVASIAPRAGSLVAEGLLSAQAAGHLQEVCTALESLKAAREDYLAQRGSERREYLFGEALQDEHWHRVRHAARRCFSAMREGAPADARGVAP
ncbi:MAG TPA: hypothetical protein VKV27_15920 [Solirubrobacteraceae bacterium]|nr:hypothetical protein [Solirubrobacteraceae bacterium]